MIFCQLHPSKIILECSLIELREQWPRSCSVGWPEGVHLRLCSARQFHQEILHQGCLLVLQLSLHCSHLFLQRGLDGFLDGRCHLKIRTIAWSNWIQLPTPRVRLSPTEPGWRSIPWVHRTSPTILVRTARWRWRGPGSLGLGRDGPVSRVFLLLFGP